MKMVMVRRNVLIVPTESMQYLPLKKTLFKKSFSRRRKSTFGWVFNQTVSRISGPTPLGELEDHVGLHQPVHRRPLHPRGHAGSAAAK